MNNIEQSPPVPDVGSSSKTMTNEMINALTDYLGEPANTPIRAPAPSPSAAQDFNWNSLEESVDASLDEMRRSGQLSRSGASELRLVLKYVTSNMTKAMEHMNEVAKGVLLLDDKMRKMVDPEQ